MEVFCILNAHSDAYKFHCHCKELGLALLLFADVVLLFSHRSKSSTLHLMNNLEKFSNFSGLHPSLHKSNYYLNNCERDVVRWFNGRFYIPHDTIPVKFLGIPLISSKLCVNDCMPLVEKIMS